MAKVPSTAALRWLRANDIPHTVHSYAYVERGGTASSSHALGVDEHVVIKTLIFHDADRQPLIVLMHGDRHVSAKALARVLGMRSVEPCSPAVAQKHSGFRVGGTSPFGTRRDMPVYIERTVLALDAVYVNGGARGVLVCLDPGAFIVPLGAIPVDVARP